MATPFTKIYPYFIHQIDDFMLNSLENQEILYKVIEKYLLNALLEVQNLSNFYMDIDVDTKQFNTDLSFADILILAKAMKLSWINEKIYTEENFTANIGDRDYKLESSHHIVGALQETQRALRAELKQDYMRSRYSKPNFMSGG